MLSQNIWKISIFSWNFYFFGKVSRVFLAEYINTECFLRLRKVMYITKSSIFLFSATLVKSFLSISSIYLVVSLCNNIRPLDKFLFSILALVNKIIFWKNRVFLSLSFIWKLVKTISNILKVEPSIFCIPILVQRILKPSFNMYTNVMALTSLLVFKLFSSFFKDFGFIETLKNWQICFLELRLFYLRGFLL